MYAALILIKTPVTQITQTTVLALVLVSALFVIGLLVLLSVFLFREKEPLKYGNFFVVALGIMAALIGYLVAFPLIISGVFSDPTQVLAILSALFGTIVGLVGTYFGIKASSDAAAGAQKLAAASGGDTTPPQVLSQTPQDTDENVPPDIHPTATFSKEMDRATITPNTFKLLDTDTLQPVLPKVPSGVDYDELTKVATFTPGAPLQNGRKYAATITSGVKDKAGNALDQDKTWHFTTEQEGTSEQEGASEQPHQVQPRDG